METKIITTSFDDRADVHWPTATLQCELESIEDAFRDCNSELSGAEMPPLTYSFQADAISEMTENMMKLQVYAGTVRNQIYLELDNPLYQHFKDNATETLSQIILDEITTDNTIGMEEYYEVAGKGKVYGRTRVKKNLTMRDFLGLQEITPESGMPVLENVETIGEFASMFRKDYDIMTTMYVDVNACIEAYMTSGEYNHHAYHPIGDMLSGVLDITVIKPIIECFTGTDLITGERLTETEKAWKAVGAAIDAITFGQGTTALKGVKLFSTEAFETIGRTFMWDLVSESAAYGINYAGQQIGMPEGFNWILTAATGMTVSMAGDKFILEGVDGTKIKKSFKEMKEWLVEKLRKSEGGSVPKTRLETGGRNLDELSVDELLALDDEAARLYEIIRNSSDDVARISSQTGIPEWKIQKIKDHVFNNDHILRDRVGTFDPDIEIADAWERLMNGNYNQNDLDLLNHEYYEYRFEEFFGTDYGTAHNRTVETGRVWDPYKEVD